MITGRHAVKQMYIKYSFSQDTSTKTTFCLTVKMEIQDSIVAPIVLFVCITWESIHQHVSIWRWRNDLIIGVLIGTLLFCEVNSYLFFCLKTGELQKNYPYD